MPGGGGEGREMNGRVRDRQIVWKKARCALKCKNDSAPAAAFRTAAAPHGLRRERAAAGGRAPRRKRRPRPRRNHPMADVEGLDAASARQRTDTYNNAQTPSGGAVDAASARQGGAAAILTTQALAGPGIHK